MFRAVEVQNSSPAVFDEEEAIKSSELQYGNRKEVEGGDNLAMVVEECEPRLALFLSHAVASDIAGSERPLVRTRRTRLGAVRHGCAASPARILCFHRRISSRM